MEYHEDIDFTQSIQMLSGRYIWQNYFLNYLLISETFYHICNTGMKTNTIHKLWWWQFGQS